MSYKKPIKMPMEWVKSIEKWERYDKNCKYGSYQAKLQPLMVDDLCEKTQMNEKIEFEANWAKMRVRMSLDLIHTCV